MEHLMRLKSNIPRNNYSRIDNGYLKLNLYGSATGREKQK